MMKWFFKSKPPSSGMKFNSNQYYWANVKMNEKSIIIQTCSGLGLTFIDHLHLPHILPLDVDDENLGKTLLTALEHSRTFVYGTEEDKDFFDPENRVIRYNARIQYLCDQLGYKSKRNLLKKMLSCSIELHNGKIEMSPMRHVKLEAYDGMNEENDIIVPLDSTPAEIGENLKIALSRCV